MTANQLSLSKAKFLGPDLRPKTFRFQ